MLDGLRGYWYCDLLLTLDEAQRVWARSAAILVWASRQRDLLDIALGHLSLGRAHLLLGRPNQARVSLDDAIDGLRAAGQLEDLIRGLLVRSAYYGTMKDQPAAWRDLEEARRLVQRSGFRLFEADVALEEARLLLAEGRCDDANAKRALDRGRALVKQMGYDRRVPEVEALLRQLG